MPTRSARGRTARRAALALALSAGLAGAQETAEEAAPGGGARTEPAPVVAPEALLELPYVYPLLPMRPPPASR